MVDGGSVGLLDRSESGHDLSFVGGDVLAVVKWTGTDTTLFWAFNNDVTAGALCEFKVDPRGDWKLVKGKVLTGKAAEKQEFHD